LGQAKPISQTKKHSDFHESTFDHALYDPKDHG
jgi:hypothetical protein